MFHFVGLRFGMLDRLFGGRRSLLLENVALRQQLLALTRRHPRPSLGLFDKLFWVIARRVWLAWKQSLIIVTPETVVRWHRAGFRLYWRWISRVRRQVGRRRTPKEVWELVLRMVVGSRRCFPQRGLAKLVTISATPIALGASPQPETTLRRENVSKKHGQPILRTPDLRHHVSVDPIPVVHDGEVSA